MYSAACLMEEISSSMAKEQSGRLMYEVRQICPQVACSIYSSLIGLSANYKTLDISYLHILRQFIVFVQVFLPCIQVSNDRMDYLFTDPSRRCAEQKRKNCGKWRRAFTCS